MRLFVVLAFCFVSFGARAQSTGDGFPYPSVPDSLRTPESRADYVLSHYWDNFDFADTTLLHRPEITEQGFANFVDLLPRVSSSIAARGIMAFADHVYARASGDGGDRVVDYFSSLVEKYLSDADSPLHDETLYAQFVDLMSASKFASLAERTRNEYMARNLRKNLPGSVAADFAYVDRLGVSHRLYDFSANYTLLFFYDPDCEHCHATARLLEALPQLAHAGKCKVLAIYPYDDADLWQRSMMGFPDSWTDGRSPDGAIAHDDIYYFKSMPSVYLLDEQKRVVLKNPSVRVLEETLNRIAHFVKSVKK